MAAFFFQHEQQMMMDRYGHGCGHGYGYGYGAHERCLEFVMSLN